MGDARRLLLGSFEKSLTSRRAGHDTVVNGAIISVNEVFQDLKSETRHCLHDWAALVCGRVKNRAGVVAVREEVPYKIYYVNMQSEMEW